MATTGAAALVSTLYNPGSKNLFLDFPLKYGISPLCQKRDLYIKPVNSTDDLFGNTCEFYLPKSCHYITKMQLQVQILPKYGRTTGTDTYTFRPGGLAAYIRRITISYGNSFEWVISDDFLILKTIIDTKDFVKNQMALGFVDVSELSETVKDTEFSERNFFINIPFCEGQYLPVCLLSDQIRVEIEFKNEDVCANFTGNGRTRMVPTMRVSTLNVDPSYITELLQRSDHEGINIPITQIESFRYRLSDTNKFQVPLNCFTGLISTLLFVIRRNEQNDINNFMHNKSDVKLVNFTLEHNNLMVHHYIPIKYSHPGTPAKSITAVDEKNAQLKKFVDIPQNVIYHGLNLNHCVYGMSFSIDAYKSMKENAQLGFLDFTRSNGSSLGLKFSDPVDGNHSVFVYAIKHNVLSIKGSMMSYL